MLWARLTTGNLAAPLFCVAAVAANQSVFRLGALPLATAVMLVAAVAAIALMVPDLELGVLQRERLRWFNVLLGVVIVAPLLVTFALGWNRDFPFSGDHYFHVGQAYRIAFWWLSPAGSAVVRVPTLDDVYALMKHPAGLVLSRAALAALIVAATAVVYRWHRLAALILATCCLIAWGLYEQTIFVRYPGAGYLATLPVLGPAFLLHNVELAGRLTNVFAPVLWLLVLRPWLIGRWPDARVLAFGVLLFWHKDVIYYFDSVYMEPWALTFCLIAIELLIDRGARGAPLACLLIGAAATVKEPVIFALPLLWLAGAPWRGSWRDFWHLSGCALAAGVPFVLYYLARNSAADEGIEAGRAFQFGLPNGPLSPYLRLFAEGMSAAFTPTSGLLFVVALALLLVLTLRFPERRLSVACLGVAGVLLAAFYMVDRNSAGWIGYFRFLLPGLPFLAAGVLMLGYMVRPGWALAVGAAALLLQGPSASVAIARAAGPITGLNFIEHRDAAIFFPIKSLIAEARAKGLLAPGETIFANPPDTSLRVIPGLPVSYGAPGTVLCECSQAHPAVMGLYIRYVNLAAPTAGPGGRATSFGLPSDREPLWRAATAARPACLARLQSTCGHVFQRIEGGELVAVLGTAR